MCPDGFEFLDNSRCIKIMNTGKAKTAADTDCLNENPRSTLLTPKDQITHDKLEQYLTRTQLSPSANADFFLGITHSEGQWKWDDTKAPVFTESMFSNDCYAFIFIMFYYNNVSPKSPTNLYYFYALIFSGRYNKSNSDSQRLLHIFSIRRTRFI